MTNSIFLSRMIVVNEWNISSSSSAPRVATISDSFVVFRITSVIWSTVEEGERHRQGQERSGDSSRQHRQRASHPHQTGETETSYRCVCVCVFDASALIKNEITHLTSIRARGSPGSSNQTVRRRRGKGFHCFSLRRSFLFFFYCRSSVRPLHGSPSSFKAASSPLLSLPELFDWCFAHAPLVLEQQWAIRWWRHSTNKSAN